MPRLTPRPPSYPLSPRALERVALNFGRLCKAKGLSQEKLAKVARSDRAYVSQLDRCVTNISIDGLERLAQAMGVDITELLRPPA